MNLRMGVQGALPPDWLQEKFDEGHEWEEAIVNEAVFHHNLQHLDTQVEARIDLTPTIAIRGAVDGLGSLHPQGAAVGVEAKKLGPRLYSEFRKGFSHFWNYAPYYRDQLTIYMTALNCPFIFAVGQWDPDEKKVVEVHSHLITEPPGDIVRIKNKILKVEARARTGDVGECDGTHSFPCPVWFLHVKADRAEVSTSDAPMLEALGREYAEGHAMETRGKAMKAEARSKLMKALEAGGYIDPENELANPPEAVNGVQVTPYFHTYTQLDREALANDGIDIAEYQIKGRSPALKVTIKE